MGTQEEGQHARRSARRSPGYVDATVGGGVPPHDDRGTGPGAARSQEQYQNDGAQGSHGCRVGGTRGAACMNYRAAAGWRQCGAPAGIKAPLPGSSRCTCGAVPSSSLSVSPILAGFGPVCPNPEGARRSRAGPLGDACKCNVRGANLLASAQRPQAGHKSLGAARFQCVWWCVCAGVVGSRPKQAIMF